MRSRLLLSMRTAVAGVSPVKKSVLNKRSIEAVFVSTPDRCTVCGDCVESCAYSALRLIGERLTPEELMDRVLPDKAYFR